MQRNERMYASGKQGRTASEQAEFEASAAVRRKLRTGYAPLASVGPPEADAYKASCADPPLPMLATDWYKIKRFDKLLSGALSQPKLDGVRCVADTDTGALFSRTGKRFVGLDHLSTALKRAADVAAPPARWIDCELYRHGKSFQGIVSAARRTINQDPSNAAALELHMFDVIKATPCEARVQEMAAWASACEALLPPGTIDALRVVPTRYIRDCADSKELAREVFAEVDHYEQQGYEGAILRVADAPYACNKRSLGLVKAKNFKQDEFEVVGLQERPRQPGIVATVQCTTATGTQFGATPECTTEEKREMWTRRTDYLSGDWIATVRFQEHTDAGVPRFPVCAGLRHKDDTGKTGVDEPDVGEPDAGV